MPTFEDYCNELRGQIEILKKDVKDILGTTKDMDREVGANTMLSYRHLEDARMRLGKAIQAFSDGVSIYDKKDGD